MTKLFKRIISLSMAIALSLSFCPTAFAAETDMDVDIATGIATNNDDFHIPVYGNLTGYLSGISSSEVQSYSFTFYESGAYLYLFYNTTAKTRVRIYKDGILEWEWLCLGTSGETESVLMKGNSFPDGFWSPGTYTITFSFAPNQHGQPYILSVYSTQYLH